MARKSNTKKITLIAMLAALSVALLYVGSFIEVLDLSVAVLASLLCIVAVIEYGHGTAWALFALSAILSLLILPNKMPAIVYTAFFGYYPIIKEKLEKHLRKWLSWIVKIVIFNAAILLMLMASKYLLTANAEAPVFDILFIALAEVTLVIYDIALTRVITLYIFKIRKRFKFLSKR